MDGTLIDTIDDLATACETVLTEFGFGNSDGSPVHTRDEYHRFVGNGIKKLVERALGAQATPTVLEKAYQRFLVVYNDGCKIKTAPYDGIYNLLDALKEKGIKMGVVTNKAEQQARFLADAFFKDYDFCCVYGSVDSRPNKPHPASIELALADCGAEKNTTIFVGDSDVDVETAHNGGLICAGAAWGFRGEEELRRAGAEIILQQPLDLLQCFS